MKNKISNKLIASLPIILFILLFILALHIELVYSEHDIFIAILRAIFISSNAIWLKIYLDNKTKE